MSDLFNFGRAATSGTGEGNYGSTGDMKKTQYVLQLLGAPSDAGTLKCLITSVEMGMETDAAVLDVLGEQQKTEEFKKVSPFEITPALKEADYHLAGEVGIMSYIEARGLGRRLPPNNAALLAQQNYWGDIACSEVAPHVKTLVHEKILAPMQDNGYTPNADAIESAKKGLAAPLDALESQLSSKNFIIGDYSFADVHWTAYIHLLVEAGEKELVDKRSNLKSWFDRIRQHKSYSGQNIVAYELLPKADDIKQNRLNSVHIDDY